jgi:hypothetical protein
MTMSTVTSERLPLVLANNSEQRFYFKAKLLNFNRKLRRFRLMVPTCLTVQEFRRGSPAVLDSRARLR